MQDKPIDLKRIDETAPFEVLSSLSRSINWLIKAIHKGTYQDIDSLSNIVPCLYSIVDNGFHQFIYSEEDHPEELPMRLLTDHQKLVWIDTELRYLEKSFDQLHDFLLVISEESEAGREWDPDALDEYKDVFESFCPSMCSIKHTCLYEFKELMQIFLPSDIFGERNSIMRQVFERNRSNIATTLETNFLLAGNNAGWTYKAGYATKCGVDAYVTASLLFSLANWKRNKNMLLKAVNFWNPSIIKSCIQSINSLQEKDGENAGSWKEFYANNVIYRVRTTAKIAIFLISLRKEGIQVSNETINKARERVKNSFTQKGSCSDISCFSDVTKARESDIPGTIASIELELTEGTTGPRELDTVDRVNWLLNQQRYDGSWPILSKSLLDSSKEAGNTSVRFTPEEHKEKNISLDNTVDAIRTLILYYKSYLEDLDKRLKPRP